MLGRPAIHTRWPQTFGSRLCQRHRPKVDIRSPRNPSFIMLALSVLSLGAGHYDGAAEVARSAKHEHSALRMEFMHRV